MEIEVDLKNKSRMQLMWTAPMFREDDTPFDASTEVGSYNIYYGTESGQYNNTMEVAGNTLYQDIDFDVIQLPFYAVMTTVDNDGRESVYSDEVAFVAKVYAPKPPTGLTAL